MWLREVATSACKVEEGRGLAVSLGIPICHWSSPADMHAWSSGEDMVLGRFWVYISLYLEAGAKTVDTVRSVGSESAPGPLSFKDRLEKGMCKEGSGRGLGGPSRKQKRLSAAAHTLQVKQEKDRDIPAATHVSLLGGF